MLVINLVKDNLSHVWKLNERNKASGFGYSANCSILVDDIIDTVTDTTSKPFEFFDLFVEINNRAYLFKGSSSLFLVFLWSRITLCDLTNLFDCLSYFVDLLLCWLFTNRNYGRVHKDWLRSIPFSDTWNIDDSRLYSCSIWFHSI